VTQDFYAAFGVGEDERLIPTIDGQGGALAAIQGLAARDKTRERAIQTLHARNAELESARRELAAEVRAPKKMECPRCACPHRMQAYDGHLPSCRGSGAPTLDPFAPRAGRDVLSRRFARSLRRAEG
jgi:hypothetical protein